MIHSDAICSIASSGLSVGTGLRLARIVSASVFTGCMAGFWSESRLNFRRAGCSARIVSAVCSVVIARTSGASVLRYSARLASDTRAAVAKRSWSSGSLLPSALMSARRASFQAEQVTAVDQLGMFRVLTDVGDHRLIKARWCQVDQVHRAGEFLVLARRHLGGDKDAEVADALMHRIDNRLPLATISRSSSYKSVIQPRACCGGVMSSPQEQKTMIGERMLRRSMRTPSSVRSAPDVSLLPTNRLSAIHCISPALSNTGLPHQVSNSRKRAASVSTLE